MSLEIAIQANTAAIQQLTALMMGGKFMSADALKAVMTVGHVSGDDEAEEEPVFEPVVKTPEPKPTIVGDEEAFGPLAATEPSKALTYEADVLPVLHKFLVAKGKAAAEALLKKYAVDKFSKVPAAQLGDLLADINNEMGVA